MQTPAPLQFGVGSAHSFAGSVPVGTFEQVPSEPATLQALHVPTHVVSQQTVSTQLPDWHSVPIAHATPFASLVHAPLPSQLSAPAHSFAGSIPFGMFEHVPALPATLQLLHVPLHVVAQHTLSMQLFERHSAPTAHV